MKRLVYSPSVKAWVKSDTGVVDLSPYITNCMIHRRIDDVSKLEIVFRNPKITDSNGKQRFMFTEHEVDGKIMPLFHPMDPITVVCERIAGRPIQMFTGYCDTTPYVQLFPGVARIKASCTLKRLQHTYWDPALPFVDDFMKTYGWNVNPNTGAASPSAKRAKILETKTIFSTGENLNDGSIANLLFAVLQEIGGWDPSNIWIQSLPDNIVSTVYKLFDEFTSENKKVNIEISNFLSTLVGSGSFGAANAGGTNNSNTSTSTSNGNPTGQAASVGYPLAIRGILGSNVADHMARPLGNWQSDNALDISVPVGTAEFAVADGIIKRCGGYYNDGSGQTEGLKFTLITNDNEWFYQHSSERFVVNEQLVKKGDPLAKTGKGNGVPHLHIACKNGNPQTLLGL
jgi:Peptidase family M23